MHRTRKVGGKKKSRGTRERASKILEALCRVYLAEREREKEREYEHTDDGEEAALREEEEDTMKRNYDTTWTTRETKETMEKKKQKHPPCIIFQDDEGGCAGNPVAKPATPFRERLLQAGETRMRGRDVQLVPAPQPFRRFFVSASVNSLLPDNGVAFPPSSTSSIDQFSNSWNSWNCWEEMGKG